MTDLEKAARQAREALNDIHPGNMTPMAEEYWNKAITALRQALEQPAHVPEAHEQEPVAWHESTPDFYINESSRNAIMLHNHVRGRHYFNKRKEGECVVPVWFEPCPQAPATPLHGEPLLREIAALSANALDDYKLIQKLMAEREPLTDEQADKIIKAYWGEMKGGPLMAHRDYIRTVEAAHSIGEKK